MLAAQTAMITDRIWPTADVLQRDAHHEDGVRLMPLVYRTEDVKASQSVPALCRGSHRGRTSGHAGLHT